MKNKELKSNNSPPVKLWVVTLVWAFIGCALIYVNRTESLDKISGFVAGMSSPLAFIWLIYGYNMQRRELSLQRDSLNAQKAEFQRFADNAEYANVIQRSAFQPNLHADVIVNYKKIRDGSNSPTYLNADITIVNKNQKLFAVQKIFMIARNDIVGSISRYQEAHLKNDKKYIQSLNIEQFDWEAVQRHPIYVVYRDVTGFCSILTFTIQGFDLKDENQGEFAIWFEKIHYSQIRTFPTSLNNISKLFRELGVTQSKQFR